MAAAVAMRLVPPALLPRALSIIFSGIAVGTVVAVPLGSYLGGVYGWRSAFFAAAAVGVVTLAFQLLTLPRLPALASTRLRTVLDVLLRPGIAMGMFGCVLVHTAHFALFTYIQPFLESTTGIGTQGLALMLLEFGAANFAGTLLAGGLLVRHPRATLVLMPVVVGIAALALVLLPASLPGQAALLALWGMAFGGVPVAWSNWVARAVPDQAESAGGSRRPKQERRRLRGRNQRTIQGREKPEQPRRVHATDRIIHAVVVEIAVAAQIFGRVGRGEPAHARVVIPPAETY